MPVFSPPLLIAFLMLGVGGALTNVVWFRMAGIVGDAGFTVDYFFGRRAMLRNFKSVLQRQDDPVRRRSLRRLLTTWYVSNVWCVLWFVAFVVTALST